MKRPKCHKRRYPDKLTARIVLAGIRPSAKRRERRAYLCPNCLGWHLTSQPKSPRNEDR